jgi:hypothetical protein
MLIQRIRDLRQPHPIFDLFQQFQGGEILDATGRWIAQRFEKARSHQDRHIMRLAIQHPGRLLRRQPGREGDIANLKGEDVDWENQTVSFIRRKTGVPVIVHLGPEALNLFEDLSAEGVLLPYLSSVRANDRATEFRSRCRQLGIQGVTLHSYRYAWAERAKTCGYLSTCRKQGRNLWQALQSVVSGAPFIPSAPHARP